MKKIVLIIVALLVVAGIGLGSYFLFFRNHNNTTTTTATDVAKAYDNLKFLQVKNYQELSDLATAQSVDIVISENDTYIVNGVNISGYVSDVVYQHNGESFTMIRWSYELCKTSDFTDDSLDALKGKLDEVQNLFQNLFEETIEVDYLYANEGYPLDKTDLNSYKQVLEGTACLDIVIQDQDGSLWNARSQLTDGVLTVNSYHSFDETLNQGTTPDYILQ